MWNHVSPHLYRCPRGLNSAQWASVAITFPGWAAFPALSTAFKADAGIGKYFAWCEISFACFRREWIVLKKNTMMVSRVIRYSMPNKLIKQDWHSRTPINFLGTLILKWEQTPSVAAVVLIISFIKIKLTYSIRTLVLFLPTTKFPAPKLWSSSSFELLLFACS